MIYVTCTSTKCSFSVCLIAEERELETLLGPSSEWYPDKYPCPVCKERCAISNKVEPDKNPRQLNIQEAWLAFSGMGLPEEQECSAAAVRQLLLEQKVIAADVQHIQGTPRCLIRSLTLEGGKVLHLGSSIHGACVYRVQGEHSYATSRS